MGCKQLQAFSWCLADDVRWYMRSASEVDLREEFESNSSNWKSCRGVRHTGHVDTTITYCWWQWREEGTHRQYDGHLRPTLTTDREKRQIVQHAGDWPKSLDYRYPPLHVSASDMGRRLYGSQRHQRLRRCHGRLSWSCPEWQWVIFGDESRFHPG